LDGDGIFFQAAVEFAEDELAGDGEGVFFTGDVKGLGKADGGFIVRCAKQDGDAAAVTRAEEEDACARFGEFEQQAGVEAGGVLDDETFDHFERDAVLALAVGVDDEGVAVAFEFKITAVDVEGGHGV